VWLVDAGELLDEPDPGPTRFLVDGLIVDQAIAPAVGRWKTTKSWAMLEIGVAVGTGTPAFGTLEIPEPGPVIYVIEESGRAALHRRLSALCRGRGMHADDVRGRLFLAPNAGVRLDDPDWQARLLEAGLRIQPRAFIFDPLARMKGAGRNESAQADMAPVIEYLRELRNETGAAPLLVAHTGHQGEHIRGTSDLESVWESRLTFKRDGETKLVTITTEHREAGEDASSTIAYELDWNDSTRTMRLRSTLLPTELRCADFLRDNGYGTTDEISAGVGIRRTVVKRAMDSLSEAGTAERTSVRRTGKDGRHIKTEVWILSGQADPRLFDPPSRAGMDRDGTSLEVPESVPPSRPLRGGQGRRTDGGRRKDET
jgi:hypothetical protein